MILRLPASIIGVLSMFSCAEPPTRSVAAEPAAVLVRGEGHPAWRVRVELARTPAEITRGLMFRERLDEDAGMLFMFQDSRVRSFWMKNTLIPLDMLFIDEQFRVVGVVENAEPETTTQRSVGVPSRYVLEVNGGLAKSHGVGAGTAVEFVNIPL